MSGISRPRILFLDAYDSFSNNITALLTTLLDVDVFILPIDSGSFDTTCPDFKAAWRKELSHYAAVVCGPGPGSPTNGRDVGLMNHVWGLEAEDLVPALGICLGFQSLVASSGGSIRRLGRGLHGMVREVEHHGLDATCSDGIFAGVSQFNATLYHSLCVDVGQDDIPSTLWEEGKWAAPRRCPDVVPLAWVREERDQGVERILMAARHKRKPFWGLQYHPESICTEPEAHQVLRNWFEAAQRWNREKRRQPLPDGRVLAGDARRKSLLSHYSTVGATERQLRMLDPAVWEQYDVGSTLENQTIELPPNVLVPDIVETVSPKAREHIILDSSNAAIPPPKSAVDVRGRYSIIALDVHETLRLEYRTGDTFATAKLSGLSGIKLDYSQRIPIPKDESIWHLVSRFHQARRTEARKSSQIPFLGGFMGYITYEQGLGDIGVALPSDRGHDRPDICLAWITKSLVVDHVKGLLHVQYLRPRESREKGWVEAIVARLQSSHLWQHASCNNQDSSLRARRCSTASKHPPRSDWKREAVIRTPSPADYEAKVRLCQEYIAAGDSYELCLTDQTTIYLSTATRHCHRQPQNAPARSSASWQLYRTLRTHQPAPFASYVRLGGATLISSSPERFLQYDSRGRCTMKPMKGTVRKSAAVQTLAQAEAILHVPKEEAENLMIVDLVRHDLHGICGPGNVVVPRLMVVEEFQSVFQMITEVEGQLPPADGGGGAGAVHTGLDVLAASLPPGSMTGAPKKRSCEILRTIEASKERSLYSGVVGYMCASGRGDWSVTIRSMFRWDDEQQQQQKQQHQQQAPGGDEMWHVGAGGAVTILSTPEGERDEMFVKLSGPLGIFTKPEA